MSNRPLARFIRLQDFIWIALFAALIATSPTRDAPEVAMLVALAVVQVLESKIPALCSTRGSIFWIALPAGRPPEQASSPALSSLPSKRLLRVLLVDDVAANREIARGILIERGHGVTEANSGDDAVQLATTTSTWC